MLLWGLSTMTGGIKYPEDRVWKSKCHKRSKARLYDAAKISFLPGTERKARCVVAPDAEVATRKAQHFMVDGNPKN